MRRAYDVASVRFAEAETMRTISGFDLMQRAARGLENTCVSLLKDSFERVAGARIVILVGAGNNGGDALFAGSRLATRGAWVVAIATGAQMHSGGAQALELAGGRIVSLPIEESELAEAVATVHRADLIVDGIVGIGGKGSLREPAATLVRSIDPDRAIRVAVDIPSGVDPDTGAVDEDGNVFRADVTVTFGCLKSGLVISPGRDFAGVVDLVDIGLEPQLAALPDVKLLQMADVASFFPAQKTQDYKYNHGVTGVVSGSAAFPGAGHMVAGAARHSGVGMVRVADRGDGVAASVISRFPDVVAADGKALVEDPHATSWVIGPGAGADQTTATNLASLLSTNLPVVIDADAISVLAADAGLREQVRSRSATTVLTPHLGEFHRLGFEIEGGRIASATRAADDLDAVVVLKGPGSVIAGPGGKVYVDPMGPPALATAGTGDVLAGLIGGVLAQDPDLPQNDVRAVAAAVFLHGLAARKAGAGERPMTSWDLVLAVPDAVASVRTIRD